MYFVDRQKIEQTLVQIEDYVTIFNSQLNWESKLEKLALERVVHLMIESILDVGNAMIDGFIMRDPGGYDDIIDILIDEKVVSVADEVPLKAIISYRKPLVQYYSEINHETILMGMKEHINVVEQFPTKIRSYLENELGPVTAFKR